MSRLSKLFRSPTTPRMAARRRLGVEALPARDVPSAVLANGVLTVTGDDGGVVRADRIEIFSPSDGQMVVRVNGVDQFSGSNAISRVEIDGLAGNDSVTINGVQSGITDGVVVRRSEAVTLGARDPISGLFSMADLRSDIRVEGANFLNLKDTASTQNRTIVVGEQAITGMGPGQISYTFGSTGNMSVETGSGADTFQIDRTPGARTRFLGGAGADTFDLRRSVGAVEINGQGGDDVIEIAGPGRSLDQIFGRVTVTDGSFRDRVTIHDENTAANNDFFDSYTATLAENRLTLAVGARTTLGSGLTISRSFNRTIDLVGLDSVDYRAATREATTSRIDIPSVARFTETRVDVGGVGETKLGSTARRLDGILGRTTLVGGQSDSTVVIDDAGQTIGRGYRIGTDQLRQPIQLGERVIDYGAYLGRITVEAGSANDQFTVDGLRADDRAMRLKGNAGVDSLTGQNQANDWSLAAGGFGSLNDQVVFQSMDTLIGRAGDDTFRFGQNGRVNGRIDGGGGFDTLDYSARTTGVTVNLTGGTATGAAAGVANIRNVFGSQAADNLTGNGLDNVLLGNGGIDNLHGGSGTGRDLLVGGADADTLRSVSTGDTIYLGGDLAAADRNNVASVKLLMAEWTSANAYNTRVANLQNGTGATGGVRLNSTVLDADGQADNYRPTVGRDVFFVDGSDTFAAGNLPAANEQVIPV